jgi:galactarate dehydratase
MLQPTTTPLPILRVNPQDNVAVVIDAGGIQAGTALPFGIVAQENIPEAQKVALYPLAQGAPVIRYGQVIGHAREAISAGTWVHEGNISLPSMPSLHDLPLATNVPQTLPPLPGFTFQGFRNADGTAGTKNILGIATTVQCVAATTEYAVRIIREKLLPRYPNVHDVVAITHNYGCGVALAAADAAIPIRTLTNLCLNPNLGGAPMIVSLGCEKLQPAQMLPDSTLPILQQEPYLVRLQDEQHTSFGDMIEAIVSIAERRLQSLNLRQRVPCPVSDLVVGMQCGGSDALSGLTANPAVGFAADLLVRAGATVIFSEVTEVRDAVHLLSAKCVNEDVARQLAREMSWYDEYLGRGGVDRSANPTPGNKIGGLANIVEKSLGSIAKAGSSPIMGVFGPGERVNRKGLIFAATPASDFICGTLQLAAGMNLHLFTTGRGTPYGLAMAPVIKIASRSSLAHRWHDLIDIDAGRIANGDATIEEIGWEIFHAVLDVASGVRETWADHWGLHNEFALFNPAPVT